MAFSTEVKHQIIYYLGYPGASLIVGNTNYHSIVNDRLSNLNSFVEDQVETLLSQISDAKEKLIETQNVGKLKAVGDIQFNTDNNERSLMKDYKRLLRELACLLDIPLRSKSGSMGSVCI